MKKSDPNPKDPIKTENPPEINGKNKNPKFQNPNQVPPTDLLAHFSSKDVGKLCGPTAIGPTPDRARRFAADELPTSFVLVESNKDQTLR